MEFSKQQIKGMKEFIWDGFTDSESVGVNLEDVLTGARFCGVKLTDKQINSVIDHYMNPDEWNDADEEVRDLIAAASDLDDGEKLFKWLEWIVGDEAYNLVEEF